MWESFKAGWDAFTNNNLVLTIVGIVGSLFAILVILSKTSIGKKALKLLADKFDGVEKKAKDAEKKVVEVQTDIKEFKKVTEEELVEFKKDSEKKVATVYLEYENFKNDVFKVLEQIPNAKVQTKIQELKVTAEEKEEEIKTILGSEYQEISEKLNTSYKKAITKLEDENAALKGELDKIKEFIAKTKETAETGDLTPQIKEEPTNGEEKNTDTTEEAL